MSELLALGASHKTAPRRGARADRADRGRRRALHCASWWPSRASPRRSRSRPATAPSSTSWSATRSRPRAACWPRWRRRAGIRPTELVEAHLLAAQLRRRAPPVPGRERARVDDRRRGRGPGPGQARLRGGARRAHDRAADQQAVPRRAGHRQARAHGDRDLRGARVSVASVAVDAARDALGDLARPPRADHRRRRDRRADRAGAARPGRRDDVRRQPPARAGDRAGRSASAAPRSSFDALPDELRAADIVVASTSSPHPILGAEELARGRASTRGPAAAADRPRGAARHRPGVRGAGRRDAARHRRPAGGRSRATCGVRRAEARKAEGIVEEEIQAFAGWLGSLEVLPTLARAAGARRRRRRAGCWPRTRAAGSRCRARDRERVEAIARAACQAAAARADACACSSSSRPAPRALQLLRELFGLDERRRRPSAESSAADESARCAARPSEATAARHPRAARWRSRRRARWRRAGATATEIVEITTAGDRGARGGDKSRWVGAHRGRAAAPARSTSPCTRPRTCRASCADGPGAGRRPRRARTARRARRRATSLDALPRRRPRRHERAAPPRRSSPRCGRTSRWCELRGNVDTRLRKLADGRGRRARARRRRAASGSDRADATARCCTSFVPAPGQGALALQARAGDPGASARGRATHAGTCAALRAERARRPTLGGDLPHAASASTRRRARCPARVRRAAGRLGWVADDAARRRRRGARAQDARRRRRASCCVARRGAGVSAGTRLPGRRGAGRPGPAHRPRASS